MNDTEEMEDMIEIAYIKQEPEIKEEIDLSCNEELDYLSIEQFDNNVHKTNDLKTFATETLSLSMASQPENNNQENCLLQKNPFCDIQIANISYTRNAEICDVSNTELDESCSENAIDKILFLCEDCNKPTASLTDHTYTKSRNRLKEVVENEEKKPKPDQIYPCKFCPFIVVNPQKYLLHLQTHELVICSCRSCHKELKVSELLNAHMLIKFRTCEICRKVFTREKGYRQHIKSHYPIPKKYPIAKQNLDSQVQTIRFEEITIKEDHEIDSKAETSVNNEEILSNRKDNENDTKAQETSVKNKEIHKEVEPSESGIKGLDSYQTSFSKYLKRSKNTNRENIERIEYPASTPSTEEINEIEKIPIVETSKGLPQPKKSKFLSSFEEANPRNKIEEVIFLFECTGCARNFVSKKAILEHVSKKHTEEFRLWETLYVKKRLLDKKPSQTLNVNEEQSKHTCRFCPLKFNTAYKYMNHLKIHHVCSHCDKTFSSKKLLEDHECEFPKSLVCHICNKTFLFRNNYIAHLNTHENDCEICRKQFTSASLLTIHRKRVHPEGICYVCHRWFSSDALLKEHRTKVHDISAMTFFCRICERNIRSERKFRAHMESHGEKRPFSCTHCGKLYARYLAMTAHSERCDLFDEKKVFECDICKKAFYNKKKFVPHMKQHFDCQEMPPIDKLSVENRKIMRLIQNMKNSKDSKNSHRVPNKMLSSSSLNFDKLRPLSFGPKIVWRESSLLTAALPSKIEEKRERERLRKYHRQKEREQLKDINLTNPPQTICFRKSEVSDINSTAEAHLPNKKIISYNLEICNEIMLNNTSEHSKKKLDKKINTVRIQGRSLLKPKTSEQNCIFAAKKRSVRRNFEDEPTEKLLILKPITKVTRKGKTEKSIKQNVRLNILSSSPNFRDIPKEDDSTLISLLPVKSEIDPLSLEDPSLETTSKMVDPTSDVEPDPLALENPLMNSKTKMINLLTENDESKPLALKNPPTVSTSEAASEPIIIDFETKNSKESSSSSNAYVLKLRHFRRRTYNAVKTANENKAGLQKKKKDSQNNREIKESESNMDYFFCTICKSQISSLLRIKHMKIHDEGLKIFECTVCKKKFNTSVGKIRHEKMHTKK